MSFFNAVFREMMMDPFMGSGGSSMNAPVTRMVRMMDSMVVQAGVIFQVLN